MQAILLRSPEHFESIEIDEPSRPAAGEALVRVARVGICGTDIAGYLGKMPFYSYPRIPGHELGVKVLAVGDGVTNVRPGETCSVEPYMNCQECFACRRGSSNCCEKLAVLGVHVDGGMRPRFIVPARKLHASAKLSLDQLALVETLAIGCHAVNRGQPSAGEHALVVGAGPIGLATLEFVKLTGAEITVLDMSPTRLAFCRGMSGVAHVVQFADDGSHLAQLREITAGAMYPVAFDATGNPRSMAGALEYCSFTGRLVYVGITTADVAIPDPLLHRREITIFASRNALPDDFVRIIRLIEEGRIDTRPWITHRTNMASLVDVFPSYVKPETGVIKAIVEVDRMIRVAVTACLVPEARGGPFVLHGDLAAACAEAAGLGFDAVEVFAPSADEVDAAALARLLAAHGLALAAMGTGAGFLKHRLTLTDPDAEVRARAVEFVRGIVELAGGLGAPAIVGSLQGRAGEGQSHEEALRWLAEALDELGRHALRLGVPLLIEPLNRYETNLLGTLADGAALARTLADGNIRLLADLFHMNIEEADSAAALRAAGNAVGHVHFADSNRRPMGSGQVDGVAIAAALAEIGYEGYVSAECLPWPDSRRAAEQTMTAYRTLFPKSAAERGG